MERRKFIRNSLALLTPTIIGGNPIHILQDHPLLNTALLATANNENVLVIIQLSGGNDGLNTVIPISDYANYYNARTNIAIPENKILKLTGNDATGIHPAMTAMQNLFSDGKLNVVQSVGYPQPSFSHFRATDIWMSGADSNEYLNTGWAGRFLNSENPDYPDGYPTKEKPDPLAIQIGSLATLTCQGPAVNMALSISDPSSFYNLIDGTNATVSNTNAGYELSFLRSIAKQTNQYTVRIKAASDSVTKQVTYPNNSLASQLKIVARLIKGGLKTKVYMVNYGGFDTHAGQVVATDTATGAHANLLKVLSDSIAAFQSDLIPRAAKQGVRVAVHSDSVTVAWSSEHYALLGNGPVTVRLTLFKSGVIHDSISFDSTTNPAQMARFLLGNPFSTPTGVPLGLVGVAATSSRLSSTLDLAATQMQLVGSESDPLNLGVVMTPNCFQVESGGTVESVSVSKLRVRLAQNRKSISLDVSGVGTGKVSLIAAVNGTACSQTAWTSLSSGKGAHRLPIPRGVGRVSFKAGAGRAGTSVSSVRRRTTKQEHLRLCSRILKPVLAAGAP